MFFKDDAQSIDVEDGFEDVEVLAEEEVALQDDFIGLDMVERGEVFDGAIVGFSVVGEDFS